MEMQRILFVDDGSSDRTWMTICALHDEHPGEIFG